MLELYGVSFMLFHPRFQQWILIKKMLTFKENIISFLKRKRKKIIMKVLGRFRSSKSRGKWGIRQVTRGEQWIRKCLRCRAVIKWDHLW